MPPSGLERLGTGTGCLEKWQSPSLQVFKRGAEEHGLVVDLVLVGGGRT